MPWHGSIARLQEIDALCVGKLKVCAEWPALTAVFGSARKLKIAEALAFAGDRGAYLLALTDVDPSTRSGSYGWYGSWARCCSSTPEVVRTTTRN